MKDHYEELINSTQPLGKMDLEVGETTLFLFVCISLTFLPPAIQDDLPAGLPRATRGEASPADREGGKCGQDGWKDT